MSRQSASQPVLQKIPKKWALAIVAAVILYVLLQPLANSRLGWHLPSPASLAGNESPLDNNASVPPSVPPSLDTSSLQGSVAIDDSPTAAEVARASAAAAAAPPVSPVAMDNSAKAEKPLPPGEAKPTSDLNLKYGLLKDLGRETYISPAGLRYTKGSEEGHRLKHLERHLSDLPDRPGKHGVFEGGMEQALRWLDDAYTRGQRGAKGVTTRSEDGRKIYEVPFTKPIGYIGGRDGKQANHPAAKRLRLVVEDDRFITGFPY